MRHFLLFLTAIFIGLFLLILNRQPQSQSPEKPILRIYAYSSFTSPWGPGPVLKEMFEKNCGCQVEFSEGSSAGVLLQKLKLEGETLGADLVIGLDQYDLQKALEGLKWQQLNFGEMNWADEIRPALNNNYFVPYDWGALTFMAHQSMPAPEQLRDLLNAEYKKKIIVQDPGNSSPGFQFLYWVIKSMGEEAGFSYLGKLFEQVVSMPPSWSASIGLFNKNNKQLVFTYVTSPIYYQVEEKKFDLVALNFKEPLPMQVEFLGVPDFCRQCDLSEQFINMVLSPEGQKVMMEKNYMLPVLKGLKQGTVYEGILNEKTLLPFEIPPAAEVDRLIRRWREVRRGQEP